MHKPLRIDGWVDYPSIHFEFNSLIVNILNIVKTSFSSNWTRHQYGDHEHKTWCRDSR